MKQFAVIGLGSFGVRVINEMLKLEAEIIIIDKDREMVEQLKDKTHGAYIVDVVDEEVINKLIPKEIDSVIIDLGDNLEATILVTNYLKKMGISNILVKAESDRHGEILKLVGAAYIIYPDLEAAKRVTPLLLSETLYNFIPISSGLVMVEIFVPEKYVGKTLLEANLRHKEGINVVAIKKGNDLEYELFVPNYTLESQDILLAVGKESNIMKFTAIEGIKKEGKLSSMLKRIITKHNK